MNIQKVITNVIDTLNIIEVKGRANLNSLLGCILALEAVKKELAAPPVTQEATDNNDNE